MLVKFQKLSELEQQKYSFEENGILFKMWVDDDINVYKTFSTKKMDFVEMNSPMKYDHYHAIAMDACRTEVDIADAIGYVDDVVTKEKIQAYLDQNPILLEHDMFEFEIKS